MRLCSCWGRPMDEYQVATRSVLPYLEQVLKWPSSLIRGYGRVPVQMGTSTRWADFLCYIVQGDKPCPYMLVEVKQEGLDLEQMVPQAESYSLILGAPFFCVTDGEEHRFYLTGQSQGNSVRLQDSAPMPFDRKLPPGVDFIQFPPQIDPLVDLFFQALEKDSGFLRDTIDHSTDLEHWNKRVFGRLDSITQDDLGNAVHENTMVKLPNEKIILTAMRQDFPKFKSFLRCIAGLVGDPVNELSRLLDRSSTLHIRGAGLFFVTQLMAAAHPGEYVVLEDNVAKALKDLQITDVLVPTDAVNGYILANDICRRIYRDKLEDRILDGNFGLATGFELVAVHNFLWHYYAFYRQGKPWSGSSS